jgi:hypothetical protein
MVDITSTIDGNTKEGKDKLEESEGAILKTALKEELNTMPYVTASTCNSLGVQVPTKLAYETNYAISKFVLGDLDVTNYVMKELKYKSRIALCDALAAEQVDAVGLAISQIKKKKGFILGDMAGIGKGRVCAAVLRYAKVNNLVPVFMTVDPSLFSSMYNDFKDIGGIDADGNLPYPFIFNTDKDSDIQEEKDGTTTTIIEAKSTKEVIALCKNKSLPSGHDCVFLTYSQLSQNLFKESNQNAIAKYAFLEAIAPNAIFVLDESHKGAGIGQIAVNIAPIIANSYGTMFASATYAKTPKSMLMYIPKTDIADSDITPKTIVEAVDQNGEVVQEYVASLLVKSGQMIRRERSYDGCDIDYDYIGLDKKDEIYAKYDKVMSLYTDIEKFVQGSLFIDASMACIRRYAEQYEIDIPSQPRPRKKAEGEKWDKDNADKWTAKHDTLTTLRGRFQWTQNLLFSLKADAVADETIKILKTQKEVEYNEKGKEFKKTSNYKPIISVRNTAESSLRQLDYKVGDIITKEQNDYSKTLIKIAESIVSGNMIFAKIKESSKDNKEKKGKRGKSSTDDQIVIENATILMSDFADGGLAYRKLKNDLSNVISGIPLSPLDHIIFKIKDAFRESWDKDYSANPRFQVEEITSRSTMVSPRYYTEGEKKGKRYEDGSFIIMKTPSATTTDKVDRFNRGDTDVIILNTTGSTGLSMHSKSNFYDRRPRIMLIHQVELDVNVEVQKRGRIFRTGQVNLPAYKYMVSVIPTEIRSLLMLKRKLRSLDANTSGNVKQSAKASEIRDRNNNIIEDISNKYGLKIIREFLEEPNNAKYQVLKTPKWNNKDSSEEDLVEDFTRSLEKLPCIDQEEFYNEVNTRYVNYKEYLVEKGEWDLDTSIQILDAAIRNKRVLFYGSEVNEFTKSVYIEDKWVNPKGVPFTKEEVLDEIAKKLNGKSENEFHSDLLEQFDTYAREGVAALREQLGEADVSQAESEEEAEKIREDHRLKVEGDIDKYKDKLNQIKLHLSYFYPKRIVELPLNMSALRDGDTDENGQRKTLASTAGYFVGYKFLNKSENRYSPMNIELQFAAPSRDNPKFKITLTKQFEGIYKWIESGFVPDRERQKVNDWMIIEVPDRPKMKILTGELFKGIEMAATLRAKDPNYVGFKLIKYTTLAGGVESGIEVEEVKHIDEHIQESKSYTPINSQKFFDYFLKKSGYYVEVLLPNGVDMIKYFYSNSSNAVYAEYHVNTGYYMTQSSRWSASPLKDFVSPNLTNDYDNELKSKFDLTKTINEIKGNFLIKGSVVYRKFQTREYTANNDAEYKKLLNFLFEKHGWLVQMKGEEEFLYKELKDPKGKQQEGDEGEGVFQYHIIAPYSKDKTPPNFIKGSLMESKESGSYGILSTRFPLSPLEASLYNLVPFGITEYQAIQNILKAVGDAQEQERYKEKVRELAKADNFIGIAIETQKAIGVLPRYAIGKVGLPESGKIIARNIDAEPTETSKAVETSEDTQDKIPLDFETAQDFIIKLKSL